MTLFKTAFMSMLVASTALTALPALAQTRAETLRHVTGASINTLDPTMPGSTRARSACLVPVPTSAGATRHVPG